MGSVKDAEILALIDRLIGEIEVARKHSLDHTVRLLEIAILDLRTIMASMSDEDLRDLTETLHDEIQTAKMVRHS